MKKYFAFFAASSALLLAGAGCTSSTSVTALPPQPTPLESNQGRAVFTVTDAAPTLEGITAVVVTVDKVEVHSTTDGWTTIANTSKKYDIFKLKQTGTSELLADANLEAGTYEQIRLTVSRVDITANGATQEAKLPSNVLKIVGDLTVTAGETSTASVDFLLDKSLHLTGSGTYILTPVVRLLTKNDVEVSVKADNVVEEDGGEVEDDETQGSDENGDMKSDFELKEELEIDADGKIKIKVKVE